MSPSRLAAPPQTAKAIVRSALGVVREVSPRFSVACQRGRGPSVVFLPCEGRSGAALLRGYNVSRALRGLGWRTLALPPSLGLHQRRRLLQAAKPDLIVMQSARHMLNRPAYYPDVPIVFDMDDADFHLPHLSGAVERAMPRVAAVLAGSSYIADWCRSAGASETHVVWTGTPVSGRPRVSQSARGPVIAWAQSRPMNYVREAEWVRSLTRSAASCFPGLILRLYDRQPEDDPVFLESFQAPGLTVEWLKNCSYSHYIKTFDDVSLGLAPLSPENPFSRGKSFGKILAYLDRHVPVVATDNFEPRAFFTDATGVLVNTPDQGAEAAVRLLGDPQARQSMTCAAFAAFQNALSVEASAARTDAILRQYLT